MASDWRSILRMMASRSMFAAVGKPTWSMSPLMLAAF
jgi:hypothetical protein